MGPGDLQDVLGDLRHQEHADLLVGLGKSDDAAVYRVSDDVAIVGTVDFFPPIVDDPYLFGAIAAANSMSDVYAMGGQVVFALNVAGFPSDLPRCRDRGRHHTAVDQVGDEAPCHVLAFVGLAPNAVVVADQLGHPLRRQIFWRYASCLDPGCQALQQDPVGSYRLRFVILGG